MNQLQVQKTVSGFRIEGRWEDIVNTGEEVSKAMKDADVDDENVEKWEEWRPREEERFDRELREKTAKTACVSKNPVEEEGKTAVEEAGEAVGDVGRAVEAATKGEREKASEKSREAAIEFALSIDTVCRKALRRFELVVYKHIATRTNPHYFDNEAVFAYVKKGNMLRLGVLTADEEQYQLSVEIEDEALSGRLEQALQERE